MSPLSNASYGNTTCNSRIFILYEETTEAIPIKNNTCTMHEFWMLVISTAHCNVAVIARMPVTLILALL